MNKQIAIGLIVLIAVFLIFRSNKSTLRQSHSEVASVKYNQAPVDPVANEAHTELSKSPESAAISDEKSSSDDAYFQKLADQPSNASANSISNALVEIALKVKDKEKAKAAISQYGIRGYTAMSLLVGEEAKANPSQANAFVDKLLWEFKGLPGNDPEARMAVCGSLANINQIDISGAIFNAISNEADPLKRRCLYDVFTSNRNFSKSFEEKLIAAALSDQDQVIQKVGMVWKRNNRILGFDEMQPYYTEIMKGTP